MAFPSLLGIVIIARKRLLNVAGKVMQIVPVINTFICHAFVPLDFGIQLQAFARGKRAKVLLLTPIFRKVYYLSLSWCKLNFG